jgi:outer membrane protein assembly factor BamE
MTRSITIEIHLYKLTVQQGNVIAEKSLAKLQPGMTKKQVVYVMGSPVLTPTENTQWDYVYTLEKRDVVVKQKFIRIFFDNDLYTHYEDKTPSLSVK